MSAICSAGNPWGGGRAVPPTGAAAAHPARCPGPRVPAAVHEPARPGRRVLRPDQPHRRPGGADRRGDAAGQRHPRRPDLSTDPGPPPDRPPQRRHLEPAERPVRHRRLLAGVHRNVHPGRLRRRGGPGNRQPEGAGAAARRDGGPGGRGPRRWRTDAGGAHEVVGRPAIWSPAPSLGQPSSAHVRLRRPSFGAPSAVPS